MDGMKTHRKFIYLLGWYENTSKIYLSAWMVWKHIENLSICLDGMKTHNKFIHSPGWYEDT